MSATDFHSSLMEHVWSRVFALVASVRIRQCALAKLTPWYRDMIHKRALTCRYTACCAAPVLLVATGGSPQVIGLSGAGDFALVCFELSCRRVRRPT